MKKRGIFGLSLLTFFTGAFFGLLISPMRMWIGNESGNTTNNYYGKEFNEENLEWKENRTGIKTLFIG